jgi:hypothetical protein
MIQTTQADKGPITLVTACMRADGLPTFAVTQVEVTPDEYDNGIHYYLAEADLLLQGYEEPFVHFDEREAPSFLHTAVKEQLGLTVAA